VGNVDKCGKPVDCRHTLVHMALSYISLKVIHRPVIVYGLFFVLTWNGFILNCMTEYN